MRANHPQIQVSFTDNVPSFTPDSIKFDILAADPDSACGNVKFSVKYSVCIPQQYNDDSSYSLDCEGKNGIPIEGNTLNPLSFFLELMNRYKDIGQVNLPVDVVMKGDRFRIPIPVMAKVSNGREEMSALKFVEFINTGRDNKNPAISKILIDETDVTAIDYSFSLVANRKYKIKPVVNKASLDKIYYEVDDKYEDEGVQLSFFAQKGEFDKVATSDKAPDVVYTTPVSDREEYTSIYIVARDFRGGIDWITMSCIRILPDKKE